MLLLLDTHTFLWATLDDPRLSAAARGLITDPSNTVEISLASAWEIAIKAGLGKLPLPQPVEVFLRRELRSTGTGVTPITFDDVLAVAKLPQHHRDPFDRLIVAQALGRGLPVVGRDAAFDAYGVRRIW